jgi:N-acetylneuraminic acid mutarotase
MIIITLLIISTFSTEFFCRWLSGSKFSGQNGIFGSTYHGLNIPGGRTNFASTFLNDTIITFGGSGFAETGSFNNLNDLWQYSFNLNLWRHLSGNTTLNALGSFGTLLEYNSNNYPPAVFSSSIVSYNNTILLFGGQHDDPSNKDYNNVWQYSIELEQWRLLSGNESYNRLGIYGTKGQYDSENIPGGRNGADMVIVNNTLILFGGVGFDKSGTNSFLNDLWQFDLTTFQWRWLSGSDTASQGGVYKNMGSFDSDARPGGRNLHTIHYYENNLLVIAGIGYDNDTSLGRLNDIWEYSFMLDQWKWLFGDELKNKLGIYGTIFEYNSTNKPGSRYSHSTLIKNNTLYLMGGWAYDSISLKLYQNDIWQYSFELGQWRWISGNDVGNQPGVYGTKGTYSFDNVIGGRQGQRMTLYNDNIYIYFGRALDINNDGERSNDLWECTETLNSCFQILSDDNQVCSGNGICDSKDNCVCNINYTRTDCSEFNLTYICSTFCDFHCFGVLYTHQSVCSQHGNCSSKDVCICEDCYSGENCDTFNTTQDGCIEPPTIEEQIMSLFNKQIFVTWIYDSAIVGLIIGLSMSIFIGTFFYLCITNK